MKVFSLEKFKKRESDWKDNLDWEKECDGQPVENGWCKGKNGCTYCMVDAWCEEVSENKLIFKSNETILIKDGKKYVSKCKDGDVYDKEKGLLLCLAKANGVSYTDLRTMIDGAEDKNKELAKKFAKSFGEALKAFVEAGRKAWGEIGTEVKALKKEAKNTVKEVDRDAKIGEYIKIVKAIGAGEIYKNGDILKVYNRDFLGVFCEMNKKEQDKINDNGNIIIWDNEYVVLENYKPYKITLSEFWKSKDKLAIHCKTEDEAKELLKAFDKAGKKWCSGRSYASHTNYEQYGKETAYTNSYGYSELSFLKKEGYKIYEFNEVDLNN